jgi:hypothetical protein
MTEDSPMLSTSTSIIIGGGFIGACLLAQLGYTVSRDRAMAQAAQREQETRAKVAIENYRRVQGKEAWKKSLENLDMSFMKWLVNERKKVGASAQFGSHNFQLLESKAFNVTDVEWNDDRHATVHGLLGVLGNKNLFSWSCKTALVSNGVDNWWVAGDPTFDYTSIDGDSAAANHALGCAAAGSISYRCLEFLVREGKRTSLVQSHDWE